MLHLWLLKTREVKWDPDALPLLSKSERQQNSRTSGSKIYNATVCHHAVKF